MTGLKTFAARMGFVVVLVLGLMGLGQGMLGCAASNSPEDAAKAALTSYLSQVQQGNVGDAVENVDSQYGAMVDTDTGQAFVEAWLEGFSYTLGDVTMEGDDACTIETTVTCKTLAPVIASGVGKAFTNAFGSLFSGGDQETIQKQTEEILIEELNGAELSTTTSTSRWKT